MAYVYDNEIPQAAHPMSWSAIMAGAITALIVHFMLNLLGVGIGATNLSAATDEAAAGTTAFGWWSISGIIAALAGGYIAGRIAKQSGHINAMSHGLAAWAISALAVVLALASGASGAMNAAGPMGAQLAQYQDVQAQIRGAADSPQDTAALQIRGEQAADAIGTGALVSFVALLIGALASGMGASWASGRARVGQTMMSQPRSDIGRYARDAEERRPH